MSATGWDRFAQMACVSASLLRRWHPDAHITVLADEVTHATWERQRNGLIEVVDEVVCAETGRLPTAAHRNRFLKTTMRQRLRGDFVYLDADAIPLGPIDQLLHQTEPLGAALEQNTKLEHHFFPSDMPGFYEGLGWRHPALPYFNAGVLVVRDCPEAYDLFERWHSKWQQSSSRTGRHQDQPAMNSAIFDSGCRVCILDSSFNSMISYFFKPWLFRGARIAHFFAANVIEGTILDHLVKHLADANEIDWLALDACRRQGHPWANGGEPWQLWRSRNHVRALWRKIERIVTARRAPAQRSDGTFESRTPQHFADVPGIHERQPTNPERQNIA